MLKYAAMAKRVKKFSKKKLDQLQVAAFRALFRMRWPEVGVDMAFASAIADTSDTHFRDALEKRPQLVKKWFKDFAELKNIY